ncbi:hypothetical protein [Paraburkholderia kururiensis]|uniref:hypothetical protein n=1 Tax=Paraburkholderia kururiensis TaxID=984307 RepID=UPI0003450C1D|nr:hypothetical protein [Paraburkholderia kururiensis]
MTDAMREAFEAWVDSRHGVTLRSGVDGSLDYPLGRLLGECWQTATAQQQATITRLEAELQALIHDNDRYRESLTAEATARIAAEDDAERYRWVRERAWYFDAATYAFELQEPWEHSDESPLDIDDIERALDAARQSAPTESAGREGS